MNYFIKLIFVTLMLTMVLSFTFGQKRIGLTVDPANDTVLVLSDGGETTLGSVLDRSVYWEIADPKILSFQIVPKHDINDPFTERPGRPHGNRLDSKVRLFKWPVVWEYSIKWVHNASGLHTHDPKIAVKPIVPLFLDMLISFAFIITSITSVIFYRKWRAALAKLENNFRQNR